MLLYAQKIKHVFFEKTLLFFIAGFLICLAGLKTPGVDADSLTYIGELYTPIENMSFLTKEPLFWFVVLVNQWLFNSSYTGFFFIFSSIGVGVKFYAINKALPGRVFFPLLVYVSVFYLVHEFTQIRGGVAIGLFLLSLKYVYHKNPKKFFLINCIAVLFHYSAIVAFPIYFMSGRRINIKFYSLLPLVGIFFAVSLEFPGVADKAVLIHSVSGFLPDELGFKLSIYADLISQNVQSDIRLFNFFYLSIITFYYFSIWNLSKVSNYSEYVIISIKLTGLMIFCFYFFSFFPVMAYRLAEFYGVALIFFIPSLAFAFRQTSIVRWLIAAWLFLYFVFSQLSTLNI